MKKLLDFKLYKKIQHPVGVFDSSDKVSSGVGFTKAKYTNKIKNIRLRAKIPGANHHQYVRPRTITDESRFFHKMKGNHPKLGWLDRLRIKRIISRTKTFTAKERIRIKEFIANKDARKKGGKHSSAKTKKAARTLIICRCGS